MIASPSKVPVCDCNVFSPRMDLVGIDRVDLASKFGLT